MNASNKMFIVIFVMLQLSCGKETYLEEESSNELNLKANSSVAILMEHILLKDGSYDNIIDQANCFSVQLPIDVSANENNITVSSIDDYDTIEAIFDASSADDDVLIIDFPITIVKNDFSEVTINSEEELTEMANTCNGEGVADDDIECIDFVYPIQASVFNKTNELISRRTFSTDKVLFTFINNLDENTVVNIAFPIQVLHADGTTMYIDNLIALETTIETAENNCDEDDDFDYNDDEEPTPSAQEQAFIDLITTCVWEIDDLEIDDHNHVNSHDNAVFTFNADGTLSADEGINSTTGTWSLFTINGTLEFTLNLATFPEINSQWHIYEIEVEDNKTKIELEHGEDEVELKQNCD